MSNIDADDMDNNDDLLSDDEMESLSRHGELISGTECPTTFESKNQQNTPHKEQTNEYEESKEIISNQPEEKAFTDEQFWQLIHMTKNLSENSNQFINVEKLETETEPQSGNSIMNKSINSEEPS